MIIQGLIQKVDWRIRVEKNRKKLLKNWLILSKSKGKFSRQNRDRRKWLRRRRKIIKMIGQIVQSKVIAQILQMRKMKNTVGRRAVMMILMMVMQIQIRKNLKNQNPCWCQRNSSLVMELKLKNREAVKQMKGRLIGKKVRSFINRKPATIIA